MLLQRSRRWQVASGIGILLMFCGTPRFSHPVADLPQLAAQHARSTGRPPGPQPQATQEIVAQFDQDGDKRLNAEERRAAREWLAEQPQRGFGPPGFAAGGPGGFAPGFGSGGPGGPGSTGGRRGPGGAGPGGPGPGGPGFSGPGFGGPGFGGPGGRGGRPAGQPGPRVQPHEVRHFPDAPLYATHVLRTFFLTFENGEWEQELAAFKSTDVEVPARLLVDGNEYPDIGVSFRGMSSFMMVPEGLKRSFKLSIDFTHSDQRLYGYNTINLLNCNGDPSMMSTALYSHIARKYMPAPKSNFVKVVVNGESWGVYAAAQQFNKDFLEENYGTRDGARWKASGNPGADAGLRYLGDDVDEYRRRFEIKSKDTDQSWQALIELCRTLEQSPPEELEQRLSSMLDIDEVLWFLALDVALVNEDGYWTRASDYSLFLDPDGKFHLIPHDMNEAFHILDADQIARLDRMREDLRETRTGPAPGIGPRSGPGLRGFGPSASVTLDPLVAVESARMPLHSKLLAVPRLRQQYLANIRTIAMQSLDWSELGPVVAGFRELIADEVQADTRKLTSWEEFQQATSDQLTDGTDRPTGRRLSLRQFAEQRREYLLTVTESVPD